MKARYSFLFVGLCIGLLIALGCQKKEEPQPSQKKAATDLKKTATDEKKAAPEAAKVYQIAVIPKGTAHPFWKAVLAGARKAEKELGCQIFWKGAENEDDRNQQIELVQSFISRGVDAIVLAPLDDTALVKPVETAVQRKIPVVIIDSGLKSDQYASFVATDNLEGGRMGARELAKAMGGKGKAILLRYNVGSASTQEREEGFLEEMKAKYPGIELLSTDQYAGVTKQSAFEASQNLLNKYGADIQGIFCPNESSAFGMLRALENAGYAGKIFFVGFDASPGLVEGLRKGAVRALIVQDPFGMGYYGVKTAVAVLQGKQVEKRIPTRVVAITPENIDTKEIQDLISPEQQAGKQ